MHSEELGDGQGIVHWVPERLAPLEMFVTLRSQRLILVHSGCINFQTVHILLPLYSTVLDYRNSCKQ